MGRRAWKTHLLEGIWTAASDAIRGCTWCTCRPSNSRATSSRPCTLAASPISYKYRGVDLLLVDDLQFFAGKRATLGELLHTIDALCARGGSWSSPPIARPRPWPAWDRNWLCGCRRGLSAASSPPLRNAARHIARAGPARYEAFRRGCRFRGGQLSRSRSRVAGCPVKNCTRRAEPWGGR